MYISQANNAPKSGASFEGAVIILFVGNISERTLEPMIKKILSAVGVLIRWKRVSTFGFCEYDGSTAGLQAVRILHDLDIAGKKLLAKVDAKINYSNWVVLIKKIQRILSELQLANLLNYVDC